MHQSLDSENAWYISLFGRCFCYPARLLHEVRWRLPRGRDPGVGGGIKTGPGEKIGEARRRLPVRLPRPTYHGPQRRRRGWEGQTEQAQGQEEEVLERGKGFGWP